MTQKYKTNILIILIDIVPTDYHERLYLLFFPSTPLPPPHPSCPYTRAER